MILVVGEQRLLLLLGLMMIVVMWLIALPTIWCGGRRIIGILKIGGRQDWRRMQRTVTVIGICTPRPETLRFGLAYPWHRGLIVLMVARSVLTRRMFVATTAAVATI